MFDEVVKDASGGNKKTLKSDFLDKGEFVIVDQGQSKIAGYTNNKELLVKELPPYVVFGDHTRAFKYIDVPFAMGADGTKVLKPKNRGILLEKYLYYFFLTLDIPNTGYNRHFKYLKELKIPLPSIAEQQKIAAILDAADSLRQKDQQLVERYTALSQSLFLEMFGDNKKPKVALSSLCEINPKKSEIVSLSKTTEVSFVPMAKVSEDGEVDLSESRALADVWAGFTYFAEGDVVFAKITPCMENGKGGIMRGLKNRIGFGTTEFHVLRPMQKETTSEWLYYLTKQKAFRENAEKNMTGSAGQKRVPTHFFDMYTVSIPSFEDQNQFAEHNQLIEAQKQQAQQSLTKSEALFNSLLQRAFTGELTAKLVA